MGTSIRVPRYDEQRVTTEPLPTVRYPTDVPLAAAGVIPEINLSGIDRAATQLYEEHIQKANQIAVTGAAAQAAELETKLMNDPDTGALNLLGANALKGRDLVAEGWRKGIDEIQQKLLHNDTQRAAFQREALNRYASMNSALLQHISSQMRVYDQNQTQAFIEGETKAAVANIAKNAPLNQIADDVTTRIARIRARVADSAARLGVSPEQKEVMLDEATSLVHLQAIQRMVELGDDLTAKKYFDTFGKDGLKGNGGKDYDEAFKVVEASSLRGESQRVSDSIVAKFPDDPRKALEETKKITDPKLRDAVDERNDHYYQQKNQFLRDEENGAYQRAVQQVEPFRRTGRRFLAMEVVNPKDWAQLSLPARQSLEKYAGDRENDDDAWLEFLSLSSEQRGSLNTQEFRTQYWSKFDNVNRMRAEAAWKQDVDATLEGKHTAKQSADMSFNQLVNQALENVNKNYVKPVKQLSREDIARVSAFRTEALQRKEQLEHETKKPARGEDIQKILDGMVRDSVFVHRPSLLPDFKLLPSMVLRNEAGQVYVPWDRIPPDAKEELRSIITKKGLTPTRDLVERLYGARRMNDVDLYDRLLTRP